MARNIASFNVKQISYCSNEGGNPPEFNWKPDTETEIIEYLALKYSQIFSL